MLFKSASPSLSPPNTPSLDNFPSLLTELRAHQQLTPQKMAEILGHHFLESDHRWTQGSLEATSESLLIPSSCSSPRPLSLPSMLTAWAPGSPGQHLPSLWCFEPPVHRANIFIPWSSLPQWSTVGLLNGKTLEREKMLGVQVEPQTTWGVRLREWLELKRE